MMLLLGPSSKVDSELLMCLSRLDVSQLPADGDFPPTANRKWLGMQSNYNSRLGQL